MAARSGGLQLARPQVRWQRFVDEAPDLASRVAERFRAHPHHVLATLTSSGAPRVSGTEVAWWREELWLGSMLGARKARDLQQDARFALHSNPGDGSMVGGDAKVTGRARELTAGPEREAIVSSLADAGPMHVFLLGLERVVLTSLAPDRSGLVIEVWTPGRPVEVTRRA